MAVAWALAFWSLLALFRVPTHFLWKPAIAATEWGHWLAAVAIAVGALAVPFRASLWAILPACAAALLFVSPVVRGLWHASSVGERIGQSFPAPEIDPTGGRGRRSPLRVADLVHISIPKVDFIHLTYHSVADTPLTLDLYRPMDESGPAPLVMVIHGGSWNSGSSSQLPGMNRYLAAAGYGVAAINYRLAPTHRFPAPLEDIRRAIAFLDEHAERYGIDASRLALIGRSSGGHLALLAAYTLGLEPIRGVVALYPPTDMHWSWARPSPRRVMDSNAIIADFLGGTPEDVPENFDRASPIRFVRPESPQTLLIHGRKDVLVSPIQSRRLTAELVRSGVRHCYLELPWGNHGMDANLAGPSGQMTLYAVERFLASSLARREVPSAVPPGEPTSY